MNRKIKVTAKVTPELRADFPTLKTYLDDRMAYLAALTVADHERDKNPDDRNQG